MDASDRQQLLDNLQARFERHPDRHPRLGWAEVRERVAGSPAALRALQAMESSGGEPDLLVDERDGSLAFFDCAPESPAPRRSLCYDRAALDGRRENRPSGSAVERAAAIGAELLDETAYRWLQRFGPFDLKTSSWLATPPEVRALGGALFGDCRYGRVFVYHNGAPSYYASRGFRTRLAV